MIQWRFQRTPRGICERGWVGGEEDYYLSKRKFVGIRGFIDFGKREFWNREGKVNYRFGRQCSVMYLYDYLFNNYLTRCTYSQNETNFSSFL